MDDPFDLQRFLLAQRGAYAGAIQELRRGAKQSHWIWFIFPQEAGLGSSVMASRYAIQSRAEAVAYLAHPVLGVRLVECAQALLKVEGRSAEKIMGEPDHLKLHSSMTLFAAISAPGSAFHAVLDRFYDGEVDSRTLDYLHRSQSP